MQVSARVDNGRELASISDVELRARLQHLRSRARAALATMQQAEALLAGLQNQVDVARNELHRRGGGSAVYCGVAVRRLAVPPLKSKDHE